MKRIQKRYTTEAEIIKYIDLAKKRRDSLILEANGCGDQRRLDKINASVRRIEDATLPRLKNCLAAFRTGLLEAITTNPAVVK